ncbi:MAG: hypothetical protein WC861_02120 [Candidatus Micrarchaeia archaeon]|jgi:hypothetical protein
MNLVFEVPNASKAKLVALLEADPYGKPCFSRNGYKVKDGAHMGQDKEKCYVFMRATDEFAIFARGKLKGLVDAEGKELAVESKPEVVAAVAKIIEEEESNAEVGFGAIFG